MPSAHIHNGLPHRTTGWGCRSRISRATNVQFTKRPSMQESNLVSMRLQKFERPQQRCAGLYPRLIILKLDDANTMLRNMILATTQRVEIVPFCVDLQERHLRDLSGREFFVQLRQHHLAGSGRNSVRGRVEAENSYQGSCGAPIGRLPELVKINRAPMAGTECEKPAFQRSTVSLPFAARRWSASAKIFRQNARYSSRILMISFCFARGSASLRQ